MSQNADPEQVKLMDVARLFPDVIHQQVLAQRVRRGEIGFAAAELGNFLHEVDQAVVAGEHKSIDQDSGTFAFGDFFQGLRDHQRIEAEGVLVNAAVFEREGGRLAVGNHNDLAHVFLLARENSLSQAQALAGVGVIGANLNTSKLAKRNFFRAIVKENAVK